MISFILNHRVIQTDADAGSTLLDFIRYKENLRGTKIGCREGDCGACTVLEGRLEGEAMIYRSVVSCLMPLGNAQGKHIVSIEGLQSDRLNPAQQAIVDHDGTQCGFCTPGFVISLTGHTLDHRASSSQRAIAALSGNICRCTGYKSIERAAITVSNLLKEKDLSNPLGWLVSNEYLPAYFLEIPGKMQKIHKMAARSRMLKVLHAASQTEHLILGGGTDLMVQQPDMVAASTPHMLFDREDLRKIYLDQETCVVGASVTASGIMESPLIQGMFPDLHTYFHLISSEPIRNMGTLGGNICNASPIADLVIFFLALDSKIHLHNQHNDNTRSMPLEDFFRGYKNVDLQPWEIIFHLSFAVPGKNHLFHFEKVSKRTTLDIASVNSAMGITMDGTTIKKARLSAGGVAPIPLFLDKTSAFLAGKQVTTRVVNEAAAIMDAEISPMSDIRGSAQYKRMLANRLLHAHFMKLFPNRHIPGTPDQINKQALNKQPR